MRITVIDNNGIKIKGDRKYYLIDNTLSHYVETYTCSDHINHIDVFVDDGKKEFIQYTNEWYEHTIYDEQHIAYKRFNNNNNTLTARLKWDIELRDFEYKESTLSELGTYLYNGKTYDILDKYVKAQTPTITEVIKPKLPKLTIDNYEEYITAVVDYLKRRYNKDINVIFPNNKKIFQKVSTIHFGVVAAQQIINQQTSFGYKSEKRFQIKYVSSPQHHINWVLFHEMAHVQYPEMNHSLPFFKKIAEMAELD
ncbi:MAG: YgjP-like metallopeptidase domain-containing protein, partial [bacterium]